MRGLAQMAIADSNLKVTEEIPLWSAGDGELGGAPLRRRVRRANRFLTVIALRPVPSPRLPPRAWS